MATNGDRNLAIDTGMIPPMSRRTEICVGAPRQRGDDPVRRHTVTTEGACSPPARG